MIQFDPISRHFGGIEIRPAERLLLVDGQPARVGARAYEILLALVERSDRCVSKTELLDAVWPGRVVEENNLQVHIWALRKLLGPSVIVTIPGQGYRFVAPAATPPDLPPARASVAPAPPEVLAPPTLFGRAIELAELCALVKAHRLVSVVGASGVGKSALAQAMASALKDAFEAGSVLVDLAATETTRHLASTISSGLRLAPNHETAAAVAAELRASHRLIVLDNCERVLPAVAGFVAALLQASPHVHLVVTSQEALRLPEEQVYRLAALAVPDDNEVPTLALARATGAVQLFEHRVRAFSRHFEVNDDNLSGVIDICRRLDGVALAIELAAARVPLLGVEGLRVGLEENTRLLEGATGNAPPRQRTLHAALEWSHALLLPQQQALLRRLAVMVGGFDLEAAQCVAADAALDEWSVIDELVELAEKSLVVTERLPQGAMRYRLLEPVRRFAMGQLIGAAEFENTRERHLAYFLSLAERAGDRLNWRRQAGWPRRLRSDHDNLLAAMSACDEVVQGADRGLQLATALAPHWLHDGLIDQAHRAIMQALSRPGAAELPQLRARALLCAGTLCAARGENLQATSHFQACIELARLRGSSELLCEASSRIAMAWIALGDRAAARVCLAEASGIARHVGSPAASAIALGAQAELERSEGRLAAARSLHGDALRHARAAGERGQIAATLFKLARVALGEDDATSVPLWLDESMAICDEIDSTCGRIESIEIGARWAARCSRWELAVCLIGAAEVHAGRLGKRSCPEYRHWRSGLDTRGRAALGPAEYEAALAKGAALAIDDAMVRLRAHLREAAQG